MRWILKVINHTSKKGRTKYLHEQLHEQEFSMICGRYSILCNTLSPCETRESPWDCSLLDYFGVRKSYPCYISMIVLFKWENCRFYNKCIFVFQLERLNWRFYWNRLCSMYIFSFDILNRLLTIVQEARYWRVCVLVLGTNLQVKSFPWSKLYEISLTNVSSRCHFLAHEIIWHASYFPDKVRFNFICIVWLIYISV